MKRRILLIIMTLLLTLGLSAAAAFADDNDSPATYFGDPIEIVSVDNWETINTRLAEISEAQECAVYIYTTNDFEGLDPQAFADDLYDGANLGYGSDQSGILLVVNFESGDWAISTKGFGMEAITVAGQEYLMDQVTAQLRDDPAAAFTTYADLCEDFLIKAHAGTPYDTGNLPGEEKGFSLPLDILIGIVIGIAIAFFIVGRQKAALKTVRREAAAKNYMRHGSLNLTARNKQFLYNTVDRIEKQSSSGNNAHISSSGEIHGGGSGKF